MSRVVWITTTDIVLVVRTVPGVVVNLAVSLCRLLQTVQAVVARVFVSRLSLRLVLPAILRRQYPVLLVCCFLLEPQLFRRLWGLYMFRAALL